MGRFEWKQGLKRAPKVPCHGATLDACPVVMMRDAPDHTAEDFVLLSGTRVREMLSEGTAPPEEFSRPEVAQILMDYYRSRAKV